MSQIKDVIYSFEDQGFLEELTSDKKFYTKELIAIQIQGVNNVRNH